jgi:hypothetical protein
MQRKELLFASMFILLLTAGFPLLRVGVTYGAPALVPTNEPHVAGLNSNMPYIAGFHVIADDLSQRGTVNATAVTVHFASAKPEYFPLDGWLGCGMFVQAQDHFFHNVDYGFYMMLVLDGSGRLFVDVGLHQTEEETAPIQAARSSLVYSYTWQVGNVDNSIPVKLTQTWFNSSSVCYSISVSGFDLVLANVDVAAMPNCGNIIPRFYVGNVVMDQFPFGRYINYFQFGIVGNMAISDTHWQVNIQNPMMLRSSGWALADKAWLLEGDRAYLDFSLMWGGAAYPGIAVQPIVIPDMNVTPFVLPPDVSVTPWLFESPRLYQVNFKYTGNQSVSNMTLWNAPPSSPETGYSTENQDLTQAARRQLPIIVALLGATMLIPFLLIKRRAKRNIG